MEKNIPEAKGTALPHRKTARVRTLDQQQPDAGGRRAFLRLMAAQGVALPSAYYLLNRPAEAQEMLALKQGNQHKGLLLRPDAVANQAANPIIRDFSDPYIELIRLLTEAAEIEHALMVQYLYAAFSLKPKYSALAGYPVPSADHLLGVAIEEMIHLGQVNRLLVALGAAPRLTRSDFPYEPDIYPFAFNLEPLNRAAAARYTYTEAPADALDRQRAKGADDIAFIDQMEAVLGKHSRPNQVGSLYQTVIDTTRELQAVQDPALPDLAPWLAQLEQIKIEGEEDHYTFFRALFMGSHKGFGGQRDVWALAPDHPDYPALALPVNPSAYVGHQRQIEDPTALSIAWLGNLHYWAMLLLLDLAYAEDVPEALELSKRHMMGPFWSIARHLPERGVGMPLDPLSMGYAPGNNRAHGMRVIDHLLAEAEALEIQLGEHLPEGYPRHVPQDSRQVLSTITLGDGKLNA